MPFDPPHHHVDEDRLSSALARLTAAIPGRVNHIEAFAAFVRTAPDQDIVRINPIRFGQRHAWSADEAIDLFLHARKIGLVAMEWQYICPGCGDVVERLGSLTSASAHYFCQVCSTDRDADLSEFIEVTFSVTPEIRSSRYHDPWSLTPEEYFFTYRFSQSVVVDDGSTLADHLRRCAVACRFVDPGSTETFTMNAEPGFLWFTNGPALIVEDARTEERRTFAFEYTGTRTKGFRAEIAAGPVEVEFTNATDERYALMITALPDHYELTMQPRLTGSQLLSNQTFLDLFASERIVDGVGLAVQRIAFLFTDLKGSTALYERIGDMKAFDLVRQHFGYLRESISANSGALVKTIGDAVMASFVDPVDALRSALDMRTRIADFNATAGSDLIGLKIGLHAGACLAVTLNDRLDYFGQTVNIAARVQALSEAGEIIFTEDIWSIPGVADLLEGSQIESLDVALRGVEGPVHVHRLGT